MKSKLVAIKENVGVTRILIQQLVIPAMIGVYSKERETLQPLVFDFDIELNADLTRSFKTDDIADTVDYAKVCRVVREYVQNTQFQLLESLAKHVCEQLLSQFPISKCAVKITKKPADLKDVLGVAVEYEGRK